MKFLIIISFILLVNSLVYSQSTIKVYDFYKFVPLKEIGNLNSHEFELTIEYYSKNKLLQSKSFYINGKLSDTTFYLYDKHRRPIFAQTYQMFYDGLKKTTSSKTIYNQNSTIQKIIHYDDYRYQGFSGFEKYFYKEKTIFKVEHYNSDSLLTETNIFKQGKNSILTIRKNSNGTVEQINRETFDKGKKIRFEINFSPKSEQDTVFSKTNNYTYFPNGLLKTEDNLHYEYKFDNKRRWIFKIVFENNERISSSFRQID